MKEVVNIILTPQELTHYIPVDRHHAEVLQTSILKSGQLSPILVWAENNQIIDGFHRHQALSDLDRAIQCRVIDCSEEEFRDARITSAVTHKGVVFPRVVMWAREIFSSTDWAKEITAAQAFHIDRNIQTGTGIKRVKKLGLSIDEMGELWSWVNEKSEIWGISSEQIARMLDVADLTTPYLVSLVRQKRYSAEPVLTRPALSYVSSVIPEHREQEAVIQKALDERLKEEDMRELASKYAKTPNPEAKERVLNILWSEQRVIYKPTKKIYIPPTEEEIKQQQEKWLISYISGIMEDLVDKFDVEEIAGFISKYPNLKANFDQTAEELSIKIAQYQNRETSVIQMLKYRLIAVQTKNEDLDDENKQLKIRLARFERIYGFAQKIEEDSRKAQE